METQPGEHSVPIVLDLPKGLVSEAAFRWPADPIARGGMAMIFAGEDRRLGRPVILKAPREGDELPAGMAEMFQRRVTAEAKILAKLQHPAIVTIYELGRASVGWPFCVMQRVEGVALRDRLEEIAAAERDGVPRTRERLELLSNLVAIAEALAYAHERRVVHRDCTPNNIILGKRGEATLIDWGIARDLDAPAASELGLGTLADMPPSASGRMVTISAGTPPYLPLEQTQGRAADPSFDVYSFGVTLYEVVSGRTPFEWVAMTNAQARSRQLEEFLTWLKAGEPVAAAMPKDPELSGIIARAMAKDAAHRFTADELVLALKQYLTGDLVFSHRYSRTGRLARWARRHRGAALALTVVVAAGVAGAVVWGQLKRQEAAETRAQNEAMVAKQEAREKADAADAAQKDADAARKQADEAAREGKNADELRAAADRKAKTAVALEGDAQRAARRAEGTASEAKKAKEEADAQRDAALAAQSEADQQRDVAQSARGTAEHDRDVARTVASSAERDRDAARTAESQAQRDRDAARAAQSVAEKDRDDARTAQSAAEKERDDARKELVVLEAKLKALESERAAPPPSQQPPPSGPALDPQ